MSVLFPAAVPVGRETDWPRGAHPLAPGLPADMNPVSLSGVSETERGPQSTRHLRRESPWDVEHRYSHFTDEVTEARRKSDSMQVPAPRSLLGPSSSVTPRLAPRRSRDPDSGPSQEALQRRGERWDTGGPTNPKQGGGETTSDARRVSSPSLLSAYLSWRSRYREPH